MNDARLKWGLFSLRATLSLFFGVWALEKFIKPETTIAIWKAFYFVPNLPVEAAYGIGAIQLAAVFCFFFGLFKYWSYGFFLVFHGIGTLTTWSRLVDPYTGSNHLFIAAIPVFGALLALFILRHDDTKFTISSKIRALS